MDKNNPNWTGMLVFVQCIIYIGWVGMIFICQVYDDDDVLVTTLKAAEEAFPAAGEISFFLAIPQVYTVVGE